MHPTDPIYVAERRRQTDRKVLFAKIVKATQLLAAALLFSITGVGVYAVGKASNDETILKELAAYADDIRQTSQAEVAFEEQFGFDLYGNYTNEHVKVLATCLSDDAVAKLKAAGVTKIFLTDNITSEKDAEAGYTYAGMAHNNGELLGRRVRLDTRYLSRSTIDHEAAHIFHYHILEKHPEFDELWKKAAGKFAAYNSVGFEKGKGHFFLDNQNAQGAHHTFVKPYGGKNIWEDVATFVEVIKNTPREFLRVIQHQEAYEAKIQLLLKFNFITLEEAETALDFLYHR